MFSVVRILTDAQTRRVSFVRPMKEREDRKRQFFLPSSSSPSAHYNAEYTCLFVGRVLSGRDKVLVNLRDSFQSTKEENRVSDESSKYSNLLQSR